MTNSTKATDSTDTGRHLATRVLLLPKDTNAHGTIFGGVILSHIDLAAAAEARRHTRHPVVTVAMREVEFHEPVHLGHIVSFYTNLIRLGTTSITVKVVVMVHDPHHPEDKERVTEAEVVYVAVDENGKKVPVSD
jgi:acyl-CoA thioesterase YciA